jgi:hypothetical protein
MLESRGVAVAAGEVGWQPVPTASLRGPGARGWPSCGSPVTASAPLRSPNRPQETSSQPRFFPQRLSSFGDRRRLAH